MKKKYLFFIIVALVLSWPIYRAMNTSKETVVIVESDSSLVKVKNDFTPSSLKINTNKSLSSTVDQQKEARGRDVPDESFDAFDKVEKNWLNKVQEIIGAENFSRYIKLRDRNEKEKMMAYEKFHDYLRLKHGENFSYNISEDQTAREKEINERYLKELLKLIGNDKFQEYTSAKDEYNEKIRRENKESLIIEF